jgi:hypothetical protein
MVYKYNTVHSSQKITPCYDADANAVIKEASCHYALASYPPLDFIIYYKFAFLGLVLVGATIAF